MKFLYENFLQFYLLALTSIIQQIIKIPLPKNDVRNSDDIKMIDFNIYHNRILTNQKLVTSYLNLYISNKVVIIPTFSDEESETKLLDILSKTNVEMFSNLCNLQK